MNFFEVVRGEGEADVLPLLGGELELLLLPHLHQLLPSGQALQAHLTFFQGLGDTPLVFILVRDVDDLLALLLSLGDGGPDVLDDVPDSWLGLGSLLVSLLVFGKIGTVSEPLPALLTEVGLLTRVTPQVLGQGPGLSEGLLADLAGEGLFAFVSPEVSLVSVLVEKALGAELAFELFDSFVSLDVEPVLGTGGEGSGTEGTLEGFVSSVDPERNRIKLRHTIRHFDNVT